MNIHVNPLYGNLSISLPPILEDMAYVEIRNSAGVLMYKKKMLVDGDIEIANARLAEGVYMIKVILGDKIFKKGVVI